MSDDLIEKLSALSVAPKADGLVSDQAIGVAGGLPAGDIQPSKSPTEAFDLSNYKATWIPPRLWRVTHSNSQCRRDGEHIVAADTTTTFRNEAELRAAVEAHLVWHSSQPKSCFLSTFWDEEHARNWGNRRQDGEKTVKLHTIDTTDLPKDFPIFELNDLTAKLNIQFKSEHEYLILHRIPSQCLVESRKLAEIERRRGKIASSLDVQLAT
jgi:hypothetical protein